MPSWTKRWLVTITARGPRVSTVRATDRTRFAAWFSNGITELFSDTDNFLEPGRVWVRGQQGNRRVVPTDRITPPTPEHIVWTRVRYQVEIGPTLGLMHAHAIIEVRLRKSANVMLRQFHRPNQPWPLVGNDDQPPAWWEQHWVQPPHEINHLANAPHAISLRRPNQPAAHVYASQFGWHVQKVRPRDPGRDDIINYISKTVPPPFPPPENNITSGVHRRRYRLYEEPESGRLIPDAAPVGDEVEV